MILLDAQALVALLGGEPAAPEVEGLLRAQDTAMGAVNLAEALDVLARRFGIAVEEARGVIDPLTDGPLALLAVEPNSAWRAAGIRARHYRRRAAPISIADCFLLALAGDTDVIATADRAVIEAARFEGIGVHPLPNSRGQRVP